METSLEAVPVAQLETLRARLSAQLETLLFAGSDDDDPQVRRVRRMLARLDEVLDDRATVTEAGPRPAARGRGASGKPPQGAASRIGSGRSD